MILDIFIFIAVLAVLVLVHEFGHFVSAKKFKMLVEEFGFGFPPRIFSKKKGETVWSINLIPLGGFVKIAGEDGEEEKRGEEEKNNQSSEILLVDKKVIEEVVVDGEVIVEREKDVIEGYQVNQPNQDLKGRTFSSKPIWQRIIVLSSGVLMNLVLGWFLLTVVFMIGTDKSIIIAEIAKDSPAEKAGLMIGDAVLGFDKMESFIGVVNENKGKEISFSVQRGKDKVDIKVVPRAETPANEGAIGVSLVSGGVDRKSFFDAVWEGLKTTGYFFGFIFVMIFKIIASLFGYGDYLKYVSGPIGVFKATSQAAGFGLIYLANLMALISINLAAINIFPFPALDGGRIAFLIAEKIKGSSISAKFQQMANGIGFILLLGLMALISVRDILRLF